jgi:ParB-like chromosome segregation protein Spo0J
MPRDAATADLARLPPYRLVPVDDLLPYENNARTHSDDQIALLARMIQEYGWTNPVLIDRDRGIIAGHGRVLAARQLGMHSVPTIQLRHLTDKQRRAYVIADNQSALQAGWDRDLLRLELGELRADGFDMPLTGFATEQLDRLFGVEGPATAAEEAQPEGKRKTVACPNCGHKFEA